MLKWFRTPRVPWITDKFKPYFWNGMAFRLRFPNGYNPADVGKKYPVIFFLHGDGESGQPSDNENQLLIGAQLFEGMINAGQFDGFLMFPQKIGPIWDTSYFTRINSVLDSLQKYCNADPDRVIPMGLSSGGIGSLRYAAVHPQRTATVIASAPPFPETLVTAQNANLHVPIWVASGGHDRLPDTTSLLKYTNAFSNKGGDIRYTLYPGLDHAIWNNQWAEPFLAPYWNNAHKANPLVFYQRNQFCSEEVITAKLGITAGFYSYEWQKNNATIAISTNGSLTVIDSSSIKSFTGNEMAVKVFGSFRVRFKRISSSEWSDWSPNPAVISMKTCNATVNEPPQARAGGDEGIILPAINFVLDGTASYDPDGLIKEYSWSQAAGSSQAILRNSNSAVAKPDSLVPGFYVFRLTVTDDKGATGTDDVLIIVDAEPPANKVPIANAGNDVILTLPTNSVLLNGTGSMDPDGNIISYNWSLVSGPSQIDLGNSASSSLNVGNLIIGTYVFRLTVTDNKEATATDDITVTVYSGPEGNRPPISNAGNDITIELPTNTVFLNGGGSTDPDGFIRDYRWSIVSGPSSYVFSNDFSPTPTVSNLTEGTYVFRLLVIDNNGAIATDEVTVFVFREGVILPVNFIDFTASRQTNIVMLNWTTSREDNSKYYVIERGINGIHYDSIGLVRAIGTAGVVTHYQFADPLPAIGDNYYRLKQVDKDNSYRYSTVENLYVGEVGFRFSIINNPAYEQLKLKVQSIRSGKLHLQVRESGGRLLLQQEKMFVQGSSIHSIPIAKLAAGIYLITVQAGTISTSDIFIKR